MKRFISITTAFILIAILMIPTFAANKKETYLVLGDSIGAGTGLSNPSTSAYGKIVAETEGYDYINDAVAGHTTQDLLSRLKEDKVKEDAKKADVISISIGGNNFLHNNIATMVSRLNSTGDMSEVEEIAKNMKTDLDEIVKQIRNINYGSVILLQTLYNPLGSNGGEMLDKALEKINTVIKECATNNTNVYIVDITAQITINDIASDHLHPNESGHQKIAQTIINVLMKPVTINPTIKETTTEKQTEKELETNTNNTETQTETQSNNNSEIPATGSEKVIIPLMTFMIASVAAIAARKNKSYMHIGKNGEI